MTQCCLCTLSPFLTNSNLTNANKFHPSLRIPLQQAAESQPTTVDKLQSQAAEWQPRPSASGVYHNTPKQGKCPGVTRITFCIHCLSDCDSSS
jgi:hypothetical protein